MNGYTHMVVGGLSAGVSVAAALSSGKFGFQIQNQIFYPLAAVVPAVIGALGPDVDLPQSIAGRWIRKILKAVILGLGGMILGLLYLSFIGGRTLLVLRPFFGLFVICCSLLVFILYSKHRRETHNIIFFIVLCFPLGWFLYFSSFSFYSNLMFSLWCGFLIGWFSHLVADSFNKKGVPWFYPFSKKHYHIAKVLTGSYQETNFRSIAIGAFAISYLFILLAGRF